MFICHTTGAGTMNGSVGDDLFRHMSPRNLLPPAQQPNPESDPRFRRLKVFEKMTEAVFYIGAWRRRLRGAQTTNIRQNPSLDPS